MRSTCNHSMRRFVEEGAIAQTLRHSAIYHKNDTGLVLVDSCFCATWSTSREKLEKGLCYCLRCRHEMSLLINQGPLYLSCWTYHSHTWRKCFLLQHVANYCTLNLEGALCRKRTGVLYRQGNGMASVNQQHGIWLCCIFNKDIIKCG